jgi:hypothetical protein
VARSLSYLALLAFGFLAGWLVGVEADSAPIAYGSAAMALLIGFGPFIIE